ncbi:hypothetical protein TCSYLVIO_006356 [Trypanosoma cruzi]|nr:hypothetical protein TCSYLVIO_006356 [Trypanosoma cruzi]
MYTSLNRHYPDLLRTFYKKSLQGVARSVPKDKGGASKRFGRAGKTARKTEAGEDEPTVADRTSDVESELEEFPPYVDPTEEQEVCLDPIRALRIPRSRFHTVKELTLCRKGITRLHSNVQLLKNLDTLIIRHNRLRQIDFLIPPRNSRDVFSDTRVHEESALVDVPHGTLRGCRFLRRLYASHNCLQTLDGDVPYLRYLEVLFLAHNRLSNLNAVSAQLRPLKCIRELDLRGNPLCDEEGYRLFLIHEHPHLEVLDRRVVRDEERKEAIAYFASGAGGAGRHRGHGHHATGSVADLAEPATGLRLTLTEPFSAGERNEGRNDVKPTKGDKKNSGPSAMEQPLVSALSKQRMSNASGGGGGTRQNEKTKFLVAFLRTYTPPVVGEVVASPRQAIFQPSACERLLEEKVWRDKQLKSKRQQKKMQELAAEQQELREKYQAFHATWALSRRGMPLSAEKWEMLTKAVESPNNTSLPDTQPAPQRRVSLRRRSIAVRQPATEQTGRKTSNPVSFNLENEPVELPRLPSPTVRKSDYSVMYDALLGRSKNVEMRIGQNVLCLPESRRLGRIKNILGQVTEFLRQPAEERGVNPKQFTSIREIQQQKDALIPEPWEHTSIEGLTTTTNSAEQLEYLYLMAMSFFLPTEFSALEGHFLTSTGEILPVQEPPRSKKQTKKDKSRQSDSTQTLTNGSNSLLVSAAAALRQRLPAALTATNIEVGPPERTTFVQIMNMLDDHSGIWDLDLEQVSEAFREEYMSKNKSICMDAFPKDEEKSVVVSSFRRGRRSVGKSRAKGESRGVSKSSSRCTDIRNVVSNTTPSQAIKASSLKLGNVLLDIVRYLPFVKNRLAFFQRKCTETASKGVNGLSGEAAREWFAKTQIALMHYERLLKAMKMANLTEESAIARLVPLEGIAVQEVQEVGSFFRSPAASS